MDLLRVADLTSAQLDRLLGRAEEVRSGRARSRPLADQLVTLYFELPSVRTRLAVSAAVTRLGGLPVPLGADELHLGPTSTVEDAAVGASAYSALVVTRLAHHAHLQRFAVAAGAPVLNGTSDRHAPLQGVTDLLTLRERFPRLDDITVGYVGDGTNVAASLLEACALAGVRLRVATPPGYEPPAEAVEFAAATAPDRVRLLTDPHEAVHGADVVYTDTWVAAETAGEGLDARLRDLAPYRVDAALLREGATDALLMHPLPAYRGREVGEGVLDSVRSLVRAQAANRLPAAQAVLEAML
jgi:ornithine carbamoyltransferase